MKRLLFAVSAMLLGIGTVRADDVSDLLEPEEAFRFSARLVSPSVIEVHYDVADGYYLYRDKFRFSVSPGAIKPGSVQFPRGVLKADPIFGKVETFRKSVTVRFPAPEVGAGGIFSLTAVSQGCADVGVCYQPMTSRTVLGADSAGENRVKPMSSLFGPRPDTR